MPSDRQAAGRWLKDIVHHIDLAESFLAGIDYAAFEADPLRFHAVTRCLEIVSEASRRLPDDLKERHPSIAWKEMAAAGNVHRHDYGSIAKRRIWQTVRLALPPLRSAIESEPTTRGDPC
jgi:uncharacterized protein with HEPN domain